jgi:hypothetical protein
VKDLYRVLFQNVLTGYVYGELPVEALKYTTTRNAPGSATITIPVDPGVSRVNPQSLISGAATAIYIERGGRFVWSGLYWDSSVDYANGTMSLECEGWLSYFRLRGVHTTKQYSQWDQADIARDLLQHAGTYGPGSLLGMITYGTETTGILRDRTYLETEHKSIGEAVEQLAAVINGFGFSFDAAWSGPAGDDLTVTYRIQYPTTGRVRDVILADGVNCDVTAAKVSGKTVRTFALVTGAGDGPEQLFASATVDASAHPRIEEITANADVKEVATLRAQAEQIIRTQANPIVLPTIELYPDAELGLDALDVGDQVRVIGGYGLVPIDGEWVVTEVDVTVDANGQEQITLTVAPLEVFVDQ